MNKYLITFESGNYEWAKDKEIKGVAAAKCIGTQKAKEQNKDMFYLVECTQWWPSAYGWAGELVKALKDECEISNIAMLIMCVLFSIVMTMGIIFAITVLSQLLRG